MKPSEIVFFAVAFLLPLLGGGVLLYLIMRTSRASRTSGTGANEQPGAARGPETPATPDDDNGGHEPGEDR